MEKQIVECQECQTRNSSDSIFCNKCGTQFGSSKKESISFTKTMIAPGEVLAKGGTLAERYEILEELGEGGMGFVYKVSDTRIHEDVALKVLKPEVASNKDTITRFGNELKYARKITHKNVCRMHDINEAAGIHFITMEYVEGETLKSVITRMGTLKLGNMLSFALQVTDGLTEAHSLGIVHRDLKPQNIMIDKEGNAKIMDFGIARSEEGRGLTAEGMVIGTPEYMSPEQVEGKTADQRSDIYALGVIFYEMVTGKVPFSGESAFSVALKHKSEKPKDPRQDNPKLPEGMARAILRCMEKDRNKRYQSAEELLAVLMAVEEMLPEKETVVQKIVPRMAAARVKKFSLRKVLVPALAAAVVVVTGIITWRLMTPTQAVIPSLSDRYRVVVIPFKNISGDQQLDFYRSTLSSLFTTDLMQSKYISVVDESQVYSVLSRMKLDDVVELTQDNLKDIAAETVATHILNGSFIKLGDQYRITTFLQDARTFESIASESADGIDDEDLFAIVDELSKKIKFQFDLTEEQIANDLDNSIADVRSNSPRAIYFFTEAQKALNKRDFSNAIEQLENAISLDKDFAMAFRLLSGVYNRLALEVDFDNDDFWANVTKYRKEALEAALRRPPTERDRLYILASNQKHEQQFHTLHELVELYPDDENGNLMLGTKYLQQQEYELARKYLEPLVRNNSNNQLVYSSLATVSMEQGLFEKAKNIIGLSLEKFPDNPANINAMVKVYIMERDFDNAIAWSEKGYELDPNEFTDFGVIGHTYFFSEDFPRAEEEYRKQLDSDSGMRNIDGTLNLIDVYKTQGRFEEIFNQAEVVLQKQVGSDITYKVYKELVYANIVKGNFEEALRQCEQLRYPYPHLRLFSLGDLYSKMQLWKKVEEVVAELEKSFEERMQNHLSRDFPEHIKNSVPVGTERIKRYSLRLQGLIEIWGGNYDRAIDLLNHAKSLFRNLHDRDIVYMINPLASAYFEKGDWERAREEYESIGIMTYGRKNYGDIYTKSFYMLGKVYEQLGKKRDARKNYERFLELWKNADPGLPEVDDAKARLAGLK